MTLPILLVCLSCFARYLCGDLEEQGAELHVTWRCNATILYRGCSPQYFYQPGSLDSALWRVSVSGLVGPTQSLLRFLCSPHEPFSLSANSTFRHLPTHFRLQSVESQMPHSANQQRSRATCSSIQLKKQAQIYLKIDAMSRSGSAGQAAPPTIKGWVVSGPLDPNKGPNLKLHPSFPLGRCCLTR